MKHHLESLLAHALAQLQAIGALPIDLAVEAKVERAKSARRKPRELAEAIVAALPASQAVHKVEIAGPGFINFFLASGAYHDTVTAILQAGARYGTSTIGNQLSIQVEFVSANPTGPLHVGHGRGAAYGAAVASLLDAAGFRVHREYYVNDAGRQMDILAASVWLRYLELLGEHFAFPSNGYKGAYVRDIAASLLDILVENFHRAAAEVMRDIPSD